MRNTLKEYIKIISGLIIMPIIISIGAGIYYDFMTFSELFLIGYSIFYSGISMSLVFLITDWTFYYQPDDYIIFDTFILPLFVLFQLLIDIFLVFFVKNIYKNKSIYTYITIIFIIKVIVIYTVGNMYI